MRVPGQVETLVHGNASHPFFGGDVRYVPTIVFSVILLVEYP